MFNILYAKYIIHTVLLEIKIRFRILTREPNES